jgi:hypothetical protein
MQTKAFIFWVISCVLFFGSYFFWISFPIVFSFLWVGALLGISIGICAMAVIVLRTKHGFTLLTMMILIAGSLLYFQDLWQRESTRLFIRIHKTEFDQIQFLLRDTHSPITIFEASVLDPLHQLEANQKEQLTQLVVHGGIQLVARHDACLSIPLHPDLWQSKRLMLYDSIPYLMPQALQITPCAYLFDVARSKK